MILQLHKSAKRNCEIVRSLKNIGVYKRLVERVVQRFRGTGSIEKRKSTGRKRTVRTAENIKKVRERIRRNRHQTVRKLAKDLKVSRSSMHNIIQKDLGMRAYKKKRVHGLTEAQRVARVKKCKHLLEWHADSEIIFSDEKLFVLEEQYNAQNDRIYAVSMDSIPATERAVERYQNAASVMVWGAISKRGKLPLLFVEKGVKITKEYYLENVLKNHLLPHAVELFGDDYFCFQQDSAPSHGAKCVQAWLSENVPDFISKEEWPSSSPDLNPLDFTIWGYMLSQLRNVKHLSLETFKTRLLQIWNDIPDEVVRASCNAFHSRLRAIFKAKGERIELLQLNIN